MAKRLERKMTAFTEADVAPSEEHLTAMSVADHVAWLAGFRVEPITAEQIDRVKLLQGLEPSDAE